MSNDARSPNAARFRRAAVLMPGAGLLLVLAGYEAGAPSLAAAPAPTFALVPPPSGEMGFVIVQFRLAGTLGDDDKINCPDGRGSNLRESFLRTVSLPERERLTEKTNETELDKKWKAYGFGPDNTNVCTNIYAFADRGPTPIMKGPTGRGFDLDDDRGRGSDDPYVCKHDGLTSPAGQAGIDNQILRVVGCSDLSRASKTSSDALVADPYMMAGEGMQVILLRGVDSLVNDPEVQVIYANTDDRPMADAAGRPIFNATFSVATSGPKSGYRNVLRGRIVNGVLTTDPKQILLSQDGGGVTTAKFDFARGRIRLEFKADGTIRGMVGGYQPLGSDMRPARTGGAGTVTIAGINCAGLYNAQRLLADGERDPRTGQCKRISYAIDLAAVPAFINDVPPARRALAK